MQKLLSLIRFFLILILSYIFLMAVIGVFDSIFIHSNDFDCLYTSKNIGAIEFVYYKFCSLTEGFL